MGYLAKLKRYSQGFRLHAAFECRPNFLDWDAQRYTGNDAPSSGPERSSNRGIRHGQKRGNGHHDLGSSKRLGDHYAARHTL